MLKEKKKQWGNLHGAHKWETNPLVGSGLQGQALSSQPNWQLFIHFENIFSMLFINVDVTQNSCR